MNAYKFLRAGRIAPYTDFRWEPAEWVDSGGVVACQRGVHACRPRDLPFWLRTELWEIELAGRLLELERKVVAERGRLVRQVDAWTPAAYAELARDCAARTRTLADNNPGNRQLLTIANDTDAVLGANDLSLTILVPYFASVAAERAGGEAERLAERSRQADWFAEHVL